MQVVCFFCTKCKNRQKNRSRFAWGLVLFNTSQMNVQASPKGCGKYSANQLCGAKQL